MPGTVLITGAAGFAGSFLVEHYAARGWDVVGTIHRPLVDQSWVPAAARLVEVDLCDQVSVVELIADTRPDIVQHLAAQSSVSASWNDPMGTLDTNARLQYNILEAVTRVHPQARVLVVGSCDEYGVVEPADNPVVETRPLRPASPYGISKVVQDLMADQYTMIHDLSVMRVRPFLQVGPRRAPRFVAGSFARQIAEIELGLRDPAIEVGNVDLVRDFTDVRDVVRAYALVAERGAVGEVYNVASGQPRSARQLLETMLREARVEASIREEPLLVRGNESSMLVGDASKLRASLAWRPEISFEQSARDTVGYWRQYLRSALVGEG